MGEHAVGQGGVHRAREELAADYAGLLGAAERFDVSDRFFPGQKPRAGDHRGDRIQDMMFRFFDDSGWERLAQRRRDICAKLAHHGRNGRRGFVFDFKLSHTVGQGIQQTDAVSMNEIAVGQSNLITLGFRHA